jgi:hypothetical protein
MGSNIIWEGEDRLDLDSGYFTRKAFLVGNEACDLFEETTTKLVIDSKKKEDGRWWYLTTITLPGGVLFPDGTPDNYDWLVAPVVDLDVGSDISKGEPSRVAIEDAKKFTHFKEALVYLGML